MFFLRLTAAAGLAFALGACTLVPRNAGQGLAARTEPAPGTVSEAGPGDTVITRTSAAMRAGLLLEAPVAIRFYTLQPGFYPLVGEDDTHLFFDAPREDGCPSNCGRVSASRFADTPSAIRIPRPGTGFQPGERSEGELCVVTAYDYRLCGSGAHALIERAADIDWDWLGQPRTIGVTAGASAPETLVREVVEALAERFAVTEVVADYSPYLRDLDDRLPQEIAREPAHVEARVAQQLFAADDDEASTDRRAHTTPRYLRYPHCRV
jgi:hypothetical protein